MFAPRDSRAIVLSTPGPKPHFCEQYGEHELQFGYLWLPEGQGPHPLAIYIHGGFWRAAYSLEHGNHLGAALAQAGFAVWSIEFRRLGNAGGGWPGSLEDVRRGVAYSYQLATKYPLNLGRTVLVGHSAGGHLALLCGNSAMPVQGIVSIAGVTDLRAAYERNLDNGIAAELLGGSPAQFPERYRDASPIEQLPLGVRQVLVHGTADSRVPYELSVGYAEAARAAGDDVELVTLPETDHFAVIDPGSDVWRNVLDAVWRAVGSA